MQANQKVLKELVESSGVSFRQTVQSWIFTCPRCRKVKKLYLRKRDGRFKCMRCGPDFQGWAHRLLSELTGQSVRELSERIYGVGSTPGTGTLDLQFEDHWGEFGYDDDVIVAPELLPEIEWDPDVVEIDTPAAAKGVAYLAKRGIGLSLAKQYGVRYHPAAQRVVFPVEHHGRLLGWQARYIGQTEWIDGETGERRSIPKILTTGGLGGKCFMFQDRLDNQKHAVLVEGPIDAIKCHLCGGNVASMGKGVTKQQLDILKKSGVSRVYIGLDPDAYEDIERVLKILKAEDIECFRLEPPPGAEDLGDASPEAVLEQFRIAQPMFGWQIFAYFE